MTGPRRTLVLGGVRSGKSAWAEHQLRDEPAVRYIATAAERADDPDWTRRIALHRDRRPSHWTTLATQDLVPVLAEPDPPTLIDDLGNWLAGGIDGTNGWDGDLTAFRTAADALTEAWRTIQGRVLLVSSEVGSGVHPESRSGRIFADELGRLNTALAATADEVVLIVAGLPLWLRRPSDEPGEPR